MNIRKPTDYSLLFSELDRLMAEQLSQMELYCEIGRVVSGRVEKGAAVAASEYLQAAYPTADGFSPHNVRRMRAFYAAYEKTSEITRLAMHLGWTQNVVIMESELTNAQRISCLQRAAAERLSKKKLLEIILNGVFAEKPIDEPDEIC